MMAEPEMAEEQAVSVTFPPPPPFYHDFTAAHVARLAELQQQAQAQAEKEEEEEQSPQPHAQLGGVAVASSSSPSSPPEKKPPALPPRLPNLPPALRRLQPPPEPADGTWRVFGALYRLVDELPSLDDAEGVTRLFPPADERDRDGKGFDRATILKRLAKSLLLNFLEFVGILSLNPDDAEAKLDDLHSLFVNFHHLINEYRPHQARESLISMMQAQLDRTRAETNAIRDVKERVETMLEGLGSLKIDADDDTGHEGEGADAGLAATARRRRREALAVWARENEVARLLDDEFA